MLKSGMRPGGRVPGTKTGTVGDDDIPFGIAYGRLTRAIERLSSGEKAVYEMPEFGPMSHEDFTELNLRHAELHLSFLQFSVPRLQPTSG